MIMQWWQEGCVIMLFNWNPKLINDSLAGLTAQERAALDCLMSLTKNMTKPGAVRLKRFGFDTLDEYEARLSSAREHVRQYFAGLGISRVEDLPFEEQGRSTDARLQSAIATGKIS
jgi:hypothetical protein